MLVNKSKEKKSLNLREIKNLIFICLFFGVITQNILLSQFEQKNFTILGVSVEGNITTDAATIIANSGLKVGDEIEIPGDATNNAIKKLWKLKVFNDVQILIERQIEKGVFLLIKVTENPRLEKVIFEGFDELDEEDLNKAVKIDKGHVLTQQEIFKIKSKMKKLYDEEGLMNAQITPAQYVYKSHEIDDDELIITWINVNNSEDTYKTIYDYDASSMSDPVAKIKDKTLLVYYIEEGDDITVRNINFIGNEAFDDDDLADEFDETTPHVWWKFWRSSKFNKEDYKKDKELLKKFYFNNGYRDFEILSDSLHFYNSNKDLDIFVTVYEGNQYKIRNITWEGNTVFDAQELSDKLGFEKGDVYNLEKFQQNLFFNESQTDASSLYQNSGYLATNLEPIEKKVPPDSIDITIKVTENNRFKIGTIEITGNDKTMDKVIRRELFVVPGDYFSRGNIITSIQQLANLSYFNVEKLYSNTEGVTYKPVDDSTVSLVFNVEEKSSDYFNASVGYSGSFGFSGALGLTLTNFSIAHPFQMGEGQILNFSWQFGINNYYRTFTIGFTEPWFLDTPTMVGFELFDTRQRFIYDLRQTGFTLKSGRRLSWPDNFFYIQGFFRFQYNDVIDGGSYYKTGLTRQYTLGATLSRSDIDNPIFPSRGSKISLHGEISGGPFLPGQVDYYKFEFNADIYKRLFNSNRFALYTNISLGYMDELTKSTYIQPFEYYFMGGNGQYIATVPLRGYDDRTVGPSFGNVGGRVMTKYTVELRTALTLEPIPIYLIAFAEAGNVFLNLKETDFFNLKKSVGLGARIMIMPIGLLGFDYGYGFDRKSVDGQDPQWIFHFQFGKGF